MLTRWWGAVPRGARHPDDPENVPFCGGCQHERHARRAPAEGDHQCKPRRLDAHHARCPGGRLLRSCRSPRPGALLQSVQLCCCKACSCTASSCAAAKRVAAKRPGALLESVQVCCCKACRCAAAKRPGVLQPSLHGGARSGVALVTTETRRLWSGARGHRNTTSLVSRSWPQTLAVSTGPGASVSRSRTATPTPAGHHSDLVFCDHIPSL